MPQKLSSRAQRGILRQCRQIPRCARDDDVAFAFGDQAMRPAPLLVVAFVAWTALGVATSFGWLPSPAWPLAGVAISAAALLDLLRLRRRATPYVVRELPEALPSGFAREVTLHIESGRSEERRGGQEGDSTRRTRW